MLADTRFYLMIIAFTIFATGGLMVVSQGSPMAQLSILLHQAQAVTVVRLLFPDKDLVSQLFQIACDHIPVHAPSHRHEKVVVHAKAPQRTCHVVSTTSHRGHGFAAQDILSAFRQTLYFHDNINDSRTYYKGFHANLSLPFSSIRMQVSA